MPSGTNMVAGRREPSRIEIASEFLKILEQWNIPPTLEQVSDLYTRHILTSAPSVRRAAQILGVGRTTLYRFLRRTKV